MKNNFLKGFLAGLIIMALLAVMVAIGFNSYLGGNSTDNVAKNTEQKVEYLQKIIDKYYLNLHDTDQEDLENGVYKGLLEGLEDPYSVYYTPEEYQELKQSTSGSYYGIGVVVSQNTETGVVSAVRVFEGAPGDKAGMKAEDIIYKVDDKEVTGKDLTEVVSKMKGDKGTKVKITVYRTSENKYIDLELTREEVDVPTVAYEMLEDKIGYVEITEFDEVTYDQFAKAIKDLRNQGMKSVIFDVRDNPGGMYTIVCKMLDDLLPEGTLVYTEDKNGKKEYQKSDASNIGIPMVVLQNGNSASAAEIFAGAIKDYKAGTIVGTTSFGKGIVQNILPLPDGSAIKLTVEKYYTPNEINIHGTGIEPNEKVENNTETERDEQLQKAVDILSK